LAPGQNIYSWHNDGYETLISITTLIARVVRRVIPPSLRSPARQLAAKQSFLPEPAFQYPFRELLSAHRFPRPHYYWGALCGAFLASNLGKSRISVIEFGVAGGNGLLDLELVAATVERLSGVRIDVYGFDTGQGLPRPKDSRDLPQLWNEGQFCMDVDALQKRLSRAKLILGPVSDTVPRFIDARPAPVGFVAFDLDFYSSTMDAFRLFSAETALILPRVTCYFDDIMGFSYGDFNGERLAISDFNVASATRKLSGIYGLRYLLDVNEKWIEMMYMLHAFDHPQYPDYDGSLTVREFPLVPH
jgi:hypothetical protein